MRNPKLIILVLLLVFAVSIIANANEAKTSTKINFNFQDPVNLLSMRKTNNLQNTIRDNSYGRGKGGFLAMGIIGTIIMIIGLCMIGVGAGLIAYSLISVNTAASSGSLFGTLGAMATGTYMLYAAAGILAVGILFFCIGLPLMIVGFALYSKGRASIFMERDKELAALTTGFTIKL